MSSTQEVGDIFGQASSDSPAHAMLRSPTVLIISIGLWGMNIYFFRYFGIDYVRILRFDLMDEIEKRKVSLRFKQEQKQEQQQQNQTTTKRKPKNQNKQQQNEASHHDNSGPHRRRVMMNNGIVLPTPPSSVNININDIIIDSKKNTGTTGTTTSTNIPLSDNAKRISSSSSVGTDGDSDEELLTSLIERDQEQEKQHDHASDVDNDSKSSIDEDESGYFIYHYDSSPPPSPKSSSSSYDNHHLRISNTTTTNMSTTNERSHNRKITWARLVVLSVALMILLHYTTHVWMDEWGGNFLGATAAFYLTVTVVIILPFPILAWLRKATVIVFQRMFELIHPRCYCLLSLWRHIVKTPSSVVSYSVVSTALPTTTTTTASSSSTATTATAAGTAVDTSSSGSSNSSSSSSVDDNNSKINTSSNNNNDINNISIRPIPFVDVFFADAMCSLSKVFFDWGMLGHLLSHYPEPVPPAFHNILIPSTLSAVPYIIRARQCIVMHSVGKIKNDPKRYEHLLNALKYSTSLFPICVSAYQKTVSPERAQALEVYIIILLIINASYSLYWDIVMDWGMMHNPTAAVAVGCSSTPSLTTTSATTAATATTTTATRHNNNKRTKQNKKKTNCCRVLLRPRLRYGALVSSVILTTDTVLRFSWTLRFVSDTLFPSSDHFVLCTQFLEVFRRAIWNLLRVEWENIKQMKIIHENLSTNLDDDDVYDHHDTMESIPKDT